MTPWDVKDHKSSPSCSLARNQPVVTRQSCHLLCVSSPLAPSRDLTRAVSHQPIPRHLAVRPCIETAEVIQRAPLQLHMFPDAWLNLHQHPFSLDRNLTFRNDMAFSCAKPGFARESLTWVCTITTQPAKAAQRLDILQGQLEHGEVSVLPGKQWINQKNSWLINMCITSCQMLPLCWWLTAS